RSFLEQRLARSHPIGPKTGANCRETAELVANDPGVVKGRHIECITRAIFGFGTIIHRHEHAPFKDIAVMRGLAGRRSNNRLDVLLPTPSGFEDAPTHSIITDLTPPSLPFPFLNERVSSGLSVAFQLSCVLEASGYNATALGELRHDFLVQPDIHF